MQNVRIIFFYYLGVPALVQPFTRFAAKHPIPSFQPFPAPRTPHTTLPRWFRRHSTTGYRYATANAVASSSFIASSLKLPRPTHLNSVWPPSSTENPTHFQSSRTNEKAMHRPAKRNLRPVRAGRFLTRIATN